MFCLVFFISIFSDFVYSSDSYIDFSSGKQKVIVTLKEPGKGFVLVPLSYGSDVKGYQRLQMQDKVFKKLSIDSVVGNKFKSLNGFSAEIDSGSYANLLSDPNVLSVEIDKTVNAFLSSSVPISGANKLFGNIYSSVNVTGIGQTVCVIDTGVDYTHADLGGCFGSGCKVVGGYDFVNSDSNPMDDHGHGTHVSGIIMSTNSVNSGVAPGASIVSLKALDSSGSGSISDVVASIDWCITNKNLYNISVVSMSLGDSTFLANSTCDNYDTSMRVIINTAVANNLTVFVASGNDGNSTGISAPSCMSNTTSVGSITDSLAFSSFSNRGELLDFVAPGSSITSTKLGGGFVTASGTSMATPYMAGAAVLLRSFKMLENSTFLSVNALNNIISRTGFVVSESGRNYTGVNVSFAFYELDVNSPVVSLNVINNTVNVINDSLHFELSFSESVYDTVFIFNSTNYTLNGGFTRYSFDLFNLSNGVYNYTISGRDSVLHGFDTGVNYFRIGNNVPNLTAYPVSDLVLFLNESDFVLFNVSYFDADFDNVNISWYRNGVLSSVFDNYSFSSNSSDEGVWNITVVVSDGFSFSSVYWSVNVSVNDAPVFYDALNITVNETETVVLNVSGYDPEGENLSFIFSSPFNSSGMFVTSLGSLGNYTTVVVASDSVKNTTKTFYYQVILNVSVSSSSSSSNSSSSNSSSGSSSSSSSGSTTASSSASSSGAGGGSSGGFVASSSPVFVSSFDIADSGVSDDSSEILSNTDSSIDSILEESVTQDGVDVGSGFGFTGASVANWFMESRNSSYIILGISFVLLLFSMYVKLRSSKLFKSKTKANVAKVEVDITKKTKKKEKLSKVKKNGSFNVSFNLFKSIKSVFKRKKVKLDVIKKSKPISHKKKIRYVNASVKKELIKF